MAAGPLYYAGIIALGTMLAPFVGVFVFVLESNAWGESTALDLFIWSLIKAGHFAFALWHIITLPRYRRAAETVSWALVDFGNDGGAVAKKNDSQRAGVLPVRSTLWLNVVHWAAFLGDAAFAIVLGFNMRACGDGFTTCQSWYRPVASIALALWLVGDYWFYRATMAYETQTLRNLMPLLTFEFGKATLKDEVLWLRSKVTGPTAYAFFVAWIAIILQIVWEIRDEPRQHRPWMRLALGWAWLHFVYALYFWWRRYVVVDVPKPGLAGLRNLYWYPVELVFGVGSAAVFASVVVGLVRCWQTNAGDCNHTNFWAFIFLGIIIFIWFAFDLGIGFALRTVETRRSILWDPAEKPTVKPPVALRPTRAAARASVTLVAATTTTATWGRKLALPV